MSLTLLFPSAFALTTLVVVLWKAIAAKRHPPYPPGPPSEPIIGHMRVIPAKDIGEHFHEWAKEYGEIMHLHCLGRNMIVLDSVEAATELLEKRGAIHSCRPKFTVFGLMGWSSALTLLQYGKRFLKHRRMLHEFLNQHTCLDYIPIQTEEARSLVMRLADEPDRFAHHLNRFSAAVILRVSYGQRIETDDDPFLEMAEDVSRAVNNAGPPGNTLVDFFPSLSHLPSWFPGTYYANYARRWSYKIRRLHTYPIDLVQEQLKKGTAEDSFAKSYLTALEAPEADDEDHLEDIMGAAGVMYGAGSDTTCSALNVFVLLMTLHPEYQRNAQEEIDTVIGSNRLPEYSDRSSLPYLECIVQETLRWYPVVSVGVPHRAMEDDMYKGFFIPRGSLIFANLRGMSLDEKTYSDPHQFNPSRFLPSPQGKGEPYFEHVWGFGRRICIGQHFANASLWLAMATMLSTLNITKAKDANGEEITPKVAFTSGLIQYV
ncbi:cytochrome p450 [Moniliophthora roreri MCA 2997]|uniref:Cytochrome p450 n=1 Tax=Moniliophthora roreri (strain MCA 2997) TaxID=1381753 RepID=V2XN86_MONRO|nr:cytochrome p450 [Moniliophthora roreri MCA 2997]